MNRASTIYKKYDKKEEINKKPILYTKKQLT